ncbi:MAG: glycosyl hydrolase family 28 protein, partial [Terriglobales bacterium]
LCLTSALQATGAIAADAGTSPKYTVTVDGKSLTVGATDLGAYAGFDLRNPVTVRVTVNVDIHSVAVRPTALGIRPTVTGRTFTFQLASPSYLSIELNGIITYPLFLFSDPPRADIPNPAGKGVRYFGPGEHTGDVALGSNETLYLARGATLKGQINVVGSAQTPIKNVYILGPGVIDTRDAGNRPVRITYADSVTVDGPTILNKDAWTLAAYGTNNLQVRNTKIIASNRYSDGISIIGSTNATVDRIFVRSNDDSLVIKSGKPSFGWPYRDVSGVSVSRAVIFNGPYGNGLEIGYELAGKVHNIQYSDIDIIHKISDTNPYRRAAISIHNDGNAAVSNINYRNIRIEDANENLFYIGVLNTTEVEDRSGGLGSIGKIAFTNVSVTDPQSVPSVIEGYDAGHPVRNVMFRGLTYHGALVKEPQQLGLQTNDHTANVMFD